jgi:hypothetical protein
MFRDMGLLKVMAFKHNWNESAICQFYATLVVDLEGESLTWMTGRERRTTCFREFVAVIDLDYDEMKAGKSMKSLPPMQVHITSP